MKKVLIGLVYVSLILFLAGCDQTTNSDSGGGSSHLVVPATYELRVIEKTWAGPPFQLGNLTIESDSNVITPLRSGSSADEYPYINDKVYVISANALVDIYYFNEVATSISYSIVPVIGDSFSESGATPYTIDKTIEMKSDVFVLINVDLS